VTDTHHLLFVGLSAQPAPAVLGPLSDC
jgi:hypothetical protein